jgi:hypothetical protein
VNAIQQGDRMVKVMVSDDERSKRD